MDLDENQAFPLNLLLVLMNSYRWVELESVDLKFRYRNPLWNLRLDLGLTRRLLAGVERELPLNSPTYGKGRTGHTRTSLVSD